MTASDINHNIVRKHFLVMDEKTRRWTMDILNGHNGDFKFSAAHAAANSESAESSLIDNVLDSLGIDIADMPSFDDWQVDEDDCRRLSGIDDAAEDPASEWCDFAVGECGKIIHEILSAITSHPVYEVWIVENGSLDDFNRGWKLNPTPSVNMCWGEYDTLDEVRERFRELAEENYNREGGPCEYAGDPESECEEYVEERAKFLNIEWGNDLKWVRVREMAEFDDGCRVFVKVL